jgi:apolipoprotein N-acyltransferase
VNCDELVLPAAAAERSATVAWLQIRRWARHAAGVSPLGPFALAAVSGLVFSTSFPPHSWSSAAWIALVPLLGACAVLPPRRAAIAGLVWTAATAVGVAGFFPHMLADYFGLSTGPSWLAAFAIIACLHGIWIGAYAAWVAWLVRRRAADPLVLACGWVACEFVRAHGAFGTPWAIAAYSQVGNARIVQLADLGGPSAIGLLLAAVNAVVAALLIPALRGRRPRSSATLVAAALAAALIYGEWRLGQTFADGPAIGVAVVQGGAPVAPARRAARLAHYAALTAAGVRPSTSLIVWPESAVESYLDEATPARDAVMRVAAAAPGGLILGGPHYEASASGTRYHNSAYMVRDGRVAGRYDKHRLVPVAEDGRLTWLAGESTPRYAAGGGSFLLSAAGLRVGALLCIEGMFPELAHRAVREGAEVLVTLSNDAWFGDAAAARQQLDIATLRAVEQRRYLVRAAATGVSAVVDAHGQVLERSTFDTDAVLNATVRAAHVAARINVSATSSPGR